MIVTEKERKVLIMTVIENESGIYNDGHRELESGIDNYGHRERERDIDDDSHRECERGISFKNTKLSALRSIHDISPKYKVTK